MLQINSSETREHLGEFFRIFFLCVCVCPKLRDNVFCFFVFIPVLFLPACKIIPNNETYTSCVYNGSIAIEQRGLKEVGIMKSQDESSKITA